METDLTHYQLTDREFIRLLEDCTLDPALFNHEAHLRLAWLLIRELGANQATETIQDMLQNFVEHVGATDKYHVTLTVTAIRAVHSFMQKSNAESFDRFISESQVLLTDFKQLINSHYSIDIFSSEKARTRFLEPDLLPFI